MGRLPLLTKILLWFFLSLSILSIVLVILLQVRVYINPDSLLLGRTGARIETLQHLLPHDLSRKNLEEMNQVVQRYSEAFSTEITLLDLDLNYMAGKQIMMPENLKSEVKKRYSKDSMKRFGPPGRHEPPDMNMKARFDRPPPPKPKERNFVFKTQNPTTYWTAMPIPLFDDQPGPPEMLIMILTTHSVFRTGLYPDPLPWAITVLLIFLFSVAWWFPMVRYLVNPITEMEKATHEISKGRFQVRVSETRSDEIGRLGRSINDMAVKLDGYVQGQKRFLGDISHELGSPISRMRMGLALLEQKVNHVAQEELQDVAEEVEHMAELVEELLSFSKAETRPEKVEIGPVELAPIVSRIIERENKGGVRIFTSIPESTIVIARPELLSRALSNLLRNAIRYAGEYGSVTISFHQQEGNGQIVVTDEGPGVAPESLNHLFEPFFRQEKDRGRKTGGVGLGLAIVKTCIDACKGSISAENLSPKGFAVTITLSMPD